jgi:microcystin-dependent protein
LGKNRFKSKKNLPIAFLFLFLICFWFIGCIGTEGKTIVIQSPDKNLLTRDTNNSVYWGGQALPVLDSGKYLTNNGTILSWGTPAGSGGGTDTNWQTSWAIFDSNMKNYYVDKNRSIDQNINGIKTFTNAVKGTQDANFSRFCLPDGNCFSANNFLHSYMPTGTMQMYLGRTPPAGWLLANGGCYSSTIYPDLNAMLQSVYGACNGTDFRVPDMNGRAPIGYGNGAGLTARDLNQSGGEQTHILTTIEMPEHSHTYNIPSFNAKSATSGLPAAGSVTSSGTGLAGGGAAHNTMMPYAVVNFIIKT